MKNVDKFRQSMENVSTESKYPTFFFDSGNAIINKVISDRYDGGYAQGRLAMLAGPSSGGKSYLAGNAVAQALRDDYGVFVLDSENAFDDIYLSKIGADVDDPYYAYNGVNTLSEATRLLAEFFKHYTAQPEADRIPYLIVIDSISELQTDTQAEKGKKGEMNKDMGQHAKQSKSFLSNLMQQVKGLPIAVLITKQPYENSDGYTNKRNPYVITAANRFAFSQILMITNRLLKDKSTNIYEGIVLEVYGEKTRFAKPYQKCIIDVPYETGIDWYSGVLEAAEAMGIVSKAGAWYAFGDNKFQSKNFEKYKDEIFKELVAQESKVLNYELLPEDLEDNQPQ